MYVMGYSINNFTLLALTIAIGIVVDDAIIVLENSYRHQEELGEDPVDRRPSRHQRDRLRGDRDDRVADGGVRAAGVPPGNTGRLFNEFGIAVAGSVLISGFVALTLTPDALRPDPAGADRATARCTRRWNAASRDWPTATAGR